MKRTKTLVIALWAVFVTQAAFSQKGTEEQLIKDANSYFSSGEYLKAFPLFSQLVSLYPNHPDYNYKFGACAIYSDQDKTKAVRFLTIATNKGVEDKMAWYYLGKAYHLNYQFKDAIRAYENFIRNADPKIAAKTDAQREIETCIYGSNLLSNIKEISVISKTETDKANFFRYFNLEAIGGKILTIPSELKSKLDEKSKEPGVIHYPGNSTTIYFSSYGKDGATGKDIYKAQILPDGKFGPATKLEGDINTKYDEDFCFMHSDGKTLYFASKGHNSMGGYDIFKSTFDEKTQTFGPAVNLDFAINTPDDDIFYIADSLNQKAYFASGRASDLNHLNVYNVLVESTPLQIVYIKGEFISEINPDQHKAGIKVIDAGSGRQVCDGISGGNNGAYLMYMPRSGEYTYKVITENSPKVHEVKVVVPMFKEPVALRQEMRLVSDNGQDKLIVTNYFDQPLEEDIAALAAEMLRKKSNLDVNTTAEAVVANNTSPTKTTGSGELTTFDKTITNAPIAAGFANGITLSTVLGDMQKESNSIKQFVNESDLKSDNSLSYASKKYKEADIALKEAETIRKNLGNITTEDDIRQLRRSVELADHAEQLQREAKAAMNASESIQQYKISEKDRATQLDEQISALQAAEKSANYDACVAVLTNEKDRQTAMRNGSSSSPVSELQNKVKARESEQQREERKLNDLRESEKEIAGRLNTAEVKMNAAKKEKEKQAASNEYATIKAELDNNRKNIVTQASKVEKVGGEAQMAQANVEFYSKISENTNYGLETKEQVKLSDTEKSMLSMRLEEMKNRVNALDISDPQMLAIITDKSSEPSSPALAVSQDTKPTTSPVTSVATADVVTPKNVTSPASGAGNSAAPIKSKADTHLARIGNAPELAPERRMILAQSLAATDHEIHLLETKRAQNVLTEADNANLAALTSYHNELKKSITQNGGEPVALNGEELRGVYAVIAPDYNTKTLAITNSPGTEIDRSVRMMNYKNELLGKLKVGRNENAIAASSEMDLTKLSTLAKKDQQYESAIRVLENETGDVNQYKAAYETENKAIIESDAVFADKLQTQIAITESYSEALGMMESSKEQELINAVDAEERTVLNQQLEDIREEEQVAFKKLETYRHDLQLTASAADPQIAKSTAATSGTQTLEDMMEASDSNEGETSSENEVSEVKPEDDIQENAVTIEKMFKRKEQSESIFAYESGSFEEIVAQHMTPELQLKNREKISELNDEIFLLEAEMENESSPGKLRRLDYRAEQVYLRRSLIEIDNATNISKMTRLEYDEELAKANEMVGLNTEKIESKIMIREEIKRLRRDADVLMRNGEEIREKAPSIQDDIEKADYYRQAFAKEALAIDNLKNVQRICENLDMLIQYSEQDLAQLRVGKVPSEMLANSLTTSETTSPAVEESPSETEDIAGTSASSEVLTDTASVTAVLPENNVENNKPVELANKEADIKPDVVPSSPTVEMERSAETPGNQVVNFSTTASGDIVTNKNAVVANDAGKVNVTLAVNEPAKTVEKAAEVPVVETAGEYEVVARSVHTSPASKSNPSEVARAAENTPSNPSTSKAIANAKSGSNSSANAEEYYYSMPEVLVADLFKRTNRAVYSENRPIPIDLDMPKGVYYKVQVGAFRNDIPQNLYDEFAPVCGEKLASGITRYTAGFFMKYENADQVKKEIRSIGYADAFVVAFRDGKRIPLYEAMSTTDGENFTAAIEKEYIYGDKGEAPKSVNANSNVSGTSAGSSTNNTSASASTSVSAPNNSGVLPVVPDYYKGTPNAVSAIQVETVPGLFYTVQVGVYSKPVPAKSMKNISQLNSELTQSKKIRYTAGKYTSMMAAVEKRSEAKDLGISDAFITAYYNGRRISLSEADQLLRDNGPSILAK